jgi:glycosyltransferase involved in cell wall biosynthesis
LKFIFFCQSVSESDPIIADTMSRIEAFAKNEHVSSVDVICLRGEAKTLENGIRIYPIQPPGRDRLTTLFRLIRTMFLICSKKKIDIVYIYMAPTTAPIFYALKLFWRYRVVTWFGHANYTLLTRVSLCYFSDIWLNANKSMTPFYPSNLRLIGQGSDPEVFYPETTDKKYSMVTVCRIAESKKLELIVDAIKYCKDNFGKIYTLKICGDAYVPKDASYKAKLEKYIQHQGLQSQVTWAGSVPRSSMRTELNSANAFVFASPGGVGKSSVEAMACGLPLIITSPDAVDFFGQKLASLFLCKAEIKDLAEKIEETMCRTLEEQELIKKESLRLFANTYSLKSFVGRAISAIKEVHEPAKI